MLLYCSRAIHSVLHFIPFYKRFAFYDILLSEVFFPGRVAESWARQSLPWPSGWVQLLSQLQSPPESTEKWALLLPSIPGCQGECCWKKEVLPDLHSLPRRKGSLPHAACALRSSVVFLHPCFSRERNNFLQCQLAISASLWSFPGTASADWWLWKCSIFHFLFLDVKPAANGFHRVKLAAAGSGLRALKHTFAGVPPGFLAILLLLWEVLWAK